MKHLDQLAWEKKVLDGLSSRLSVTNTILGVYRRDKGKYEVFRDSLMKLQAAIDMVVGSGVVNITVEDQANASRKERERINDT